MSTAFNPGGAYWNSYDAARPTPPEELFSVIRAYHWSNGDPRTVVAHDVGTGSGSTAVRLSPTFDHVLASDVDRDALAAARARIPTQLHQKITFVECSAEDLANGTISKEIVRQGETDMIVMSQCMPLLEVSRALQACHSLLRPGGTLASYYYGRPSFLDGNATQCNAIYDRIATRICKCFRPFWNTPTYLHHARCADTLISYLDNIPIPTGDWEKITRHKWNCDRPFLFHSTEGYDFDTVASNEMSEEEASVEGKRQDFWVESWSAERVKLFLASLYPDYVDKAGDRYPEIQNMLEELRTEMGGERKVIFPVVLILATKKQLS